MNWLETSRRTLRREATQWQHRGSCGPSDAHRVKPQNGVCAICIVLLRKTRSSHNWAAQLNTWPPFTLKQSNTAEVEVLLASYLFHASARWGFACVLYLSVFSLAVLCPPGHRGGAGDRMYLFFPWCCKWWWAMHFWVKFGETHLLISATSLFLRPNLAAFSRSTQHVPPSVTEGKCCRANFVIMPHASCQHLKSTFGGLVSNWLAWWYCCYLKCG